MKAFDRVQLGWRAYKPFAALLTSCALFLEPLGPSDARSLPISGPNRTAIASEIDQYMRPIVGGLNFSGSILVARRGRVLFNESYGMASFELRVPNTSTIKFRLASISKQFTAAAILLLQQRGKLTVQDTVDRFIPDFPRGRQITLANLLTHTSGITGSMETLPEIAHDPETFHSLKDLTLMIQKSAFASDGSLQTDYSNKNFVLLAFIVEKVSGERYGDFLKKNIFEPLNMKDTGNEEYLQVVPGLASGYEPGISGVDTAPPDDYWNNVGAGSLYSTVGDLYKWDLALNTNTLLSSTSKETMFKPLIPGGYALGWDVTKRFGRKVLSHSGRTPGFAGDISRYPQDDAVTIVLGNIGSGAIDLIRFALGAILFGRTPEEPGKVTPTSIDPRALDPFVGTYEMSPGYFLIVRKINDHLVLSGEGTPASVLIPISDHSFFMPALYVTVIFKKDAQGRINSLIWRQDGEDTEARRHE